MRGAFRDDSRFEWRSGSATLVSLSENIGDHEDGRYQNKDQYEVNFQWPEIQKYLSFLKGFLLQIGNIRNAQLFWSSSSQQMVSRNALPSCQPVRPQRTHPALHFISSYLDHSFFERHPECHRMITD